MRVYGAGAVAAESGARLIAKRRDMPPAKFTARDIQRRAWAGLADRDSVGDALDLLEQTGHVRGELQPTREEGGRPSVVYEWNPKLCNGG
jgi:hypothetical protein